MGRKQENFWKVIKSVAGEAELLIYDVIASTSYFGDEVTPKFVNDMLNEIGEVSNLKVRINSPGGDVFAGVAIYSMLKRHPATVTAYIEGLAASISTVIPLAADKVVMAKGSMWMIHRPMSSLWMARAERLRKEADLLDKVEGEMTDIYAEKTGMSTKELAPLLDAETWYTADEAKSAGFIDEVEHERSMAACMRGNVAVINGVEVDWSKFSNPPKLAQANNDNNNDDDEEQQRKTQYSNMLKQLEIISEEV